MYQPNISLDDAIAVALEALYDAADDDSATGGPDLARRIFPVVAVADRQGVRIVDESDIAAKATRLVGNRMDRPDGPVAQVNDGGAA